LGWDRLIVGGGLLENGTAHNEAMKDPFTMVFLIPARTVFCGKLVMKNGKIGWCLRPNVNRLDAQVGGLVAVAAVASRRPGSRGADEITNFEFSEKFFRSMVGTLAY